VATSNQEAQWVLRAQCNDREALESLLGSVQPSLHRYLRRLVGATSASDVLQEVLITLFRKLPALKQPELFRPWAYRVASRVAFRHLRKERRWQEQVNDEAAIECIPAPEAPPQEELLHVLLNADVVSLGSRAVLVLHFEEELPLVQVAAILEIPLGTAKSRLAYGLAALRKQFDLRRSV
jgi:RNA polymerase sigma-70 factor (ECF subfamily)